MNRFYLDKSKLTKDFAIIEGSEARHIISVLRLNKGDKVTVFDGNSVEYEAIIDNVSLNRVELLLISKKISSKESFIKITVAQALLKDKKMDTLIRQLTELGITEWLPFVAKRSVPKPTCSSSKNRLERWQKITIEALKQCDRNNLPTVSDIISFDNVLEHSLEYDLKIIFWEQEIQSLYSMISDIKKVDKIIIIMGPEGGFSIEEIELAKEHGFIVGSLGPRILRAETATIAACSIIQYLFGDMGNKHKTE
ncbi:MAG: 16S rRNA (uracil(1498)-N(3))-methyltransferase [Desulfobacterales bacterium]|nr:16S rRNA (uracil(1498)-N(3))-methyltransferase [Desulfobacterales bacterium]